MLQNFVSEAGRIRYFVFDLLWHKSRDLTSLPLIERRKALPTLKFQNEWVKVADYFEASSDSLLRAAREQRLEGIVGKLRDSRYEPGKRSGAWIKHRLNLGQEFVIGGYTPGPHGLDAIIVGYYRGKDLIYVARTRNGFVPASRRRVFEKLKPLTNSTCPFVNLPETHKARWGEALAIAQVALLSLASMLLGQTSQPVWRDALPDKTCTSLPDPGRFQDVDVSWRKLPKRAHNSRIR